MAGIAVPMGMQALQILTAFPITGWAGANLYATGMPVLSLLKAGSYVLGLFAASFVGAIYPSIFSFIFYALMKIGQWYIFDVVDVMSSDFKRTGFRTPFHLPLPSFLNSFSETIFCSDHDCGKSGNWTLTLPLILIIAAAFTAYGYTWAANLPSEYQAYAQYFTGGGSALLASGGLASSIYSAQTASSLLAAKSLGAAQMGGGLPPLSSFAKDMKESYSEEAFDDSAPFLAILAYICAAGFGLSLVRNKMV